jgi:hypothetical protein
MSRRKNIFEKGVGFTLYQLLGVWHLVDLIDILKIDIEGTEGDIRKRGANVWFVKVGKAYRC